jgi:hypothetical protein
MLTHQIQVRTVWDDYFTGPLTLIISKEYGTGQTPSETSVYILNCLFRSITSVCNGGALFCTSVTYLLVESSSFFSCKTSDQNGGAIYFYNNGGQCVLHEVCGYNCNTTYTSSSYTYGQFACISVNNGVSSKNYVNYSSSTRCVNVNSNSYYTFCHQYGNICCHSINVSNNKCSYRPGIDCEPFCDSNSVTCSLSYSSFVDNIATACSCVMLWTMGAKYEIKCCNILRNTQDSLNSEGTIYINGNLMTKDSCILENNAKYIFYQGSYTTTLSNCTIDSNSSNRNINMQSTVTKSFILALNHMSTRSFHSEYDSVGTLTPIFPPLSPSKKQLHLCTCGNFFLHSKLSDFVSLLSVFLFNIIHSVRF